MFIVLEGLDGAGKSTQIEMLQQMLTESGHRCERLHFPRFDAPVYGDMIGRFLRGELGGVDEVNPYLVGLLYAGDRADAAHIIRAWLNEGRTVIVDRYVYSNIGYQCAKVADAAKRNELKKWILDTEYNKFSIPRPDISLFLDVPFRFTEAKLSAARTGSDRDYLSGGSDIHEQSLSLQRRVREVYLESAATDGEIRVVDCADACGNMASPEEIFSRVKAVVEPLL
ncbi:MAG: dTMP kinase [Tidjanibacter sp.]|nr:dTMP kinase [Tidjanibacter sp.]